jgi:hypothetical protein
MGNGTTELRQEGFRSWLSYFCKTPKSHIPSFLKGKNDYGSGS